MDWVERIVDDTASLLQYKEIGNVSSSGDDIKVSNNLIRADVY